MSDVILKVEGISKNYGKLEAIKDINFSLQKGEIIGLLGSNGSGKSTLLNIIALAITADKGNIFINKTDVKKNLSRARRSIGYVPQEIALFEELSVKENLLCWSKLPGKKAKERCLYIAKKMNVLDLYNKKVSALSGGMKRRVNTAVALLGNPEFLVLDEPFAGVDTYNTEWVENLLRDMANNGTSQLISGHSPEQLLNFVDRFMVLSEGKIVFLGKKEEFLAFSDNKNADQALLSILRGENI